MVLSKFKCLLLAALLPFLLWGCSDKKEEKQSVTSEVRTHDGFDAIYPQMYLSNDIIANLLSINIDKGHDFDGTEGSLYHYDWNLGFKDMKSLQTAMDLMSEYPDGDENPYLSGYSNVVRYVTKNKSDYIRVQGYARHIDDSKKTIEITDTSPSILEKFETLMNSADATDMVFYNPVILKTSAESINYIRTNKGIDLQSYGVDDLPINFFVCQRVSITAPFECEQEDVFINKHSEEVKNKLRPIYAMYEAAKAGDFSKIKIGLANDPTGEDTKRIIRKFATANEDIQFIKFFPQFYETIKEGSRKGAVRVIPSKEKDLEEAMNKVKLQPSSELYKKIMKFIADSEAFDKRLEELDISGAVVKGEAAPVEAAAAP